VTYPYVTHDDEADALYVYLTGSEVAETRNFGDLRMVDYASDGTIVGIEFLGVSNGIDLNQIPHRSIVAAAIASSGLPLHAVA
jgi:uncharacterized protein YuzE